MITSTERYIRIDNGSEPAVDADKVTWTKKVYIHVYDLTTKKETTIRSSAAFHPAISGNRLVWLEERGGVQRLTAYDLDLQTCM